MKKTYKAIGSCAVFLLALFLTAQTQPFNMQVAPTNFLTKPINFSSTGTSTIVPAQAGKQVLVWGIGLVSSCATNVTIYDGPNPLTGAMNLGTGGSIFWNPTNIPAWQTTIGNSFSIGQSGTCQVSGWVTYSQ